MSEVKPYILNDQEEFSQEQNITWLFSFTEIDAKLLVLLFQNNFIKNKTNLLHEPSLGDHIEQISWADDQIITLNEHTQRNRGAGIQYDYFFNIGYKNTWSYYLRKLILNRVYSQFENLSKKIIIAESRGIFASKNIIDILQSSKSIIILDDAEKVILTQTNDFIKYNKTLWAYTKPISYTNRISIIRYFVKKWNYLMNDFSQILEHDNKNLRKLIYVKDFERNTIQTLKEIYDFVEIDCSNDKITKISKNISKILTKNTDLHFTNLNQEEKKILQSAVNIGKKF